MVNESIPLLSEASPASALAFGVFEFIFYWCGIVALAVAGMAGGRTCGSASG